MTTTPITKYRPYLSLAEIDALLNVSLLRQDETETLKTAREALLKTRTLAELGLAKEAYKTNPRPSLTDRLGFGVSGVSAEEKAELIKSAPDFSNLMEELSKEANNGQT